MSRETRRIALVGVTALAALGASTTSAQANFQKTLTYSCVYPYVGAQPLKVAIDAAIPASYPAGQLTPKFAINAVATAGGDTAVAVATVGATSIEGITNAKSTIKATGQTLPVIVPIIVPKQAVAPSGDLVLNASGSTPSIKFLNAGPALITVDSIALNLIARTATGEAVKFDVIPPNVDSDDNPDTFDVPCKLAPTSQDTTLANVNVTGDTPGPVDTQAPSAPGTPGASDASSSTAVVSWSPSNDNVGVSSYEVNYNGKSSVTSSNNITLDGLSPSTTYSVTVRAKDAAGNISAPSPAGSFTTPASGGSTGTTIDFGYDAVGSATLKTLVQGYLNLRGTIDAKLSLPSGAFSADLNLLQTKGNLMALGLLPVSATVKITPTEKVTGTLKDGVLRANAKVRISLPYVTLFGIPVGGGGSCRAKNISNIALRSTQKVFLPLTGGPIAGTFAISELVGCGGLTGIISPLTAGSGNAIALNLTPKK